MTDTNLDITPKFKSPPPKPPRRRYSDQLPISSATLPLSKKKNCETNEPDSADVLLCYENSSGCESLPADWTTNSIEDSASLYLLKNDSLNHFQTEEIISEMRSTNLDNLTNLKSFPEPHSNISLELKRNVNSYPSNVSRLSENFKCNKNITDHIDKNCESAAYLVNGVKSENKLRALKSETKEYAKRHHSDPMIAYNDESKLSNGLHRSAFRSHSFLGCSTVESKKRLTKTISTSTSAKEVQYLYEELRVSKEINDKLWHFLCSAQENLEESEENQETANNFSISSLLSSLYHAQKIKESAIEDRMNLILEERDIAIQELEDTIQILSNYHNKDYFQDKDTDKEIKDLLKEIEVTYDPAKLLQQQKLLLSYLYHSKELKEDDVSFKLKGAIAERDNLLEKLKAMEDESNSLKISNEIWNADCQKWENSLLKILCQVIHQRDLALSNSHVKETEDFKSQHPSTFVSPQPKSSKFSHQEELHALNISFQTTNNNLKESSKNHSEEIDVLKTEVLVLNKALQLEIEKRKLADENCIRLERLVNVLQKKVHGQNVGIPV